MKGLFHLAILIFSMSTSAQQADSHETAYVIEAPSSVAYQGEDGQTLAGEGGDFIIDY